MNCSVCNRSYPDDQLIQGSVLREPIQGYVQREKPNWDSVNVLCVSCLNRFRSQYVQDALREERGELSALEVEVVKSLYEQETLARNLNVEFSEKVSVGEHLADKVAEIGGSWKFLIGFSIIITVWITLNSAILLRAFDPYPYILLNLLLSCLAAVQAPVIMMSQNRQEAKDRLRSENDYRINLKAELEIRHINLKLDQLLTHQWQRLLEIQQIQMDILEEMAERGEKVKGS